MDVKKGLTLNDDAAYNLISLVLVCAFLLFAANFIITLYYQCKVIPGPESMALEFILANTIYEISRVLLLPNVSCTLLITP